MGFLMCVLGVAVVCFVLFVVVGVLVWFFLVKLNIEL